MDAWERHLTEALLETPAWRGDPAALWKRLEPRQRRRTPWWRRPAWLGGLAAAAALAAMAVAIRMPPAPAGLPAPAGAIQAATTLLDSPVAGQPLRFAVVVGNRAGRPVEVQAGYLEVRSASGQRVWLAPIPELTARQVAGAGAVSAQVAWPRAAASGHYRATVNLSRVGTAEGQTDLGAGLAEFFIPFPAGTVRTGEVLVGQPRTRDDVTAFLDRVNLTPSETRLLFRIRGAGLTGGLLWTLAGADGTGDVPAFHSEYRQTSKGLEGVVDFEPTPAASERLVIRLHRVGVYRTGPDGARVAVEMPHTWEWLVHLH